MQLSLRTGWEFSVFWTRLHLMTYGGSHSTSGVAIADGDVSSVDAALM